MQEQLRATRARLKDIAERCGVSTSTASRALSGRPGVNGELRRRMIEAARDVGYPVPEDSLAGQRILVAASSAAMIDYGRNLFTWHVLDGMRERAAALGVTLQPLSLEGTGADGLGAALAEQRPRGVLLLTVDEPAALELVAERRLPAVIVNGDDPQMRISSVSPCNRSCARLATEHLLERGHRQVLLLTRPGRTTIQRRLEGWRDALLARGLEAGSDRVLAVEDWSPELAEAAVGRHLDQGGSRFTAMLCAGHTLAAGAYKALQARALRVPDDVSVMGIDDLPVVEFWQPPLTTMHIPAREMGAVALDMLRAQIAAAATLPRRIELACRLVVRQSVSAPRC